MTAVQHHDPLSDLGPYPWDRYENIDLDRLASFGIRVLDERGLRPTFELVVVVLFRMFPEKFGIVGFPEYPDAARVNRALLHCLPKYRNYLTGSAKTGYRLTYAGQGAAEETKELLEGSALPGAGKRQRPSAPRTVAENFMRDVRSSDAYKLFAEGNTDRIGRYELLRVLHADSETDRAILRRRLQELAGYSEQSNSHDVAKFLTWAAEGLGLNGR